MIMRKSLQQRQHIQSNCIKLYDIIEQGRYDNKDFTNNAKNINKGTNERQSSIPSASEPMKDDNAFKYETVSPSSVTPLEQCSSGPVQGLRSVKSLTRTHSLETPLGVVRQTPYPSFDSMYTNCGASQESFRQEISAHSINSMPVLVEDETLKETLRDRAHNEHTKTKDKSKIKRGKRQSSCTMFDEMVEIDLEQPNEVIEETKDSTTKGENKQTRGKLQSIGIFLKRFIPCTKSTKQDLDPDRLLDINLYPQET